MPPFPVGGQSDSELSMLSPGSYCHLFRLLGEIQNLVYVYALSLGKAALLRYY
jgi:hypothetical protein